MTWIAWKPAMGSVSGALHHMLPAEYGNHESAGWTFADGALTVHSDRLGIVPLYYSDTANRIVCADNIQEMFDQGVPCKPDRLLLACMRTMSYCPNELTIFEGVKRIPPAAVLKRGARERTTLSSTPRIPQSNGLSRNDAIEVYASLFEDGIRRLAAGRERFLVPLSGGRDSRHILLASLALGLNVETLTYNNFPPTDEDLGVAVELSRRAGCHHTVVENEQYDFHRALLRTIPTINFETDMHGWIWGMVRALQVAKSPFLDGLGGDTLSNGLFFSLETNRLLRSGKIKATVERRINILLQDKRWRLACTGRDIERLRAILEEDAARWLEWPNPALAGVFFGRTRRAVGIAPWTMSQLSKVPVLLPYLDPAVFDLLMGLDENFFAVKGFHDDTIAARYPRFADLPYGERKKDAKLGYAASLKNVLPFMHPRGPFSGARREWARAMSVALKVLAGFDFANEHWRCTDYAVSLTLAALNEKFGLNEA